jgi:hypothetical protein
MNQYGAMKAQAEMYQFQQQVAQQDLVTKQSALALDAAKFIIMLERSEEDIAQFTEDEVRNAYVTIANISRVFAPTIRMPEPESQLVS